MDPRDFHTLASRLARGSLPAEIRTSIGRAYYAAFNVAADHLRSMQFRIKRSASAHGEVQHCLANTGDTGVIKAGAELTLLHSQRNRADYQLDVNDVERGTVGQSNADTAKKIMDTLDIAFSGPHRAQIQAAISKWRRDNGYP